MIAVDQHRRDRGGECSNDHHHCSQSDMPRAELREDRHSDRFVGDLEYMERVRDIFDTMLSAISKEQIGL